MANNGIKKFALVCEKRFVNYQEILDFKLSENNEYNFKKIEIEKYKGITKSKKGKNLISDIDAMTLKYDSELAFLHSLAYYEPVHNLFVGYSSNGYIAQLKPVFNNLELQNRIKLVKGDKLYHKAIIKEKEKLVDLLVKKDSQLYKIYSKDYYCKSRTLKAALQEIRGIVKLAESKGFDSEIYPIFSFRKEQILDEFNKYYLYRELFRAYQECSKLNKNIVIPQELQTNEKLDNNEVKPKIKDLPLPYEGEQLRFK